MDNQISQYEEMLQAHFPDAKIYWSKSPDSFLDKNSCTLAVSFSSKSDDIYEFTFSNGLNVEDAKYDIDTFAEHVSHDRDKKNQCK